MIFWALGLAIVVVSLLYMLVRAEEINKFLNSENESLTTENEYLKFGLGEYELKVRALKKQLEPGEKQDNGD